MNSGLKHLTGLWRWIPKELTGCTIDLRQLDRAGEKRKQNVVGEQQIPMKTRPGISNKKTNERSSLSAEGDSPAPLLNYIEWKIEWKTTLKNQAQKTRLLKGPTDWPTKAMKVTFWIRKMASETRTRVDRRAANKRKGRRQDEQENSRRQMERPETRDRKKTSIFWKRQREINVDGLSQCFPKCQYEKQIRLL